MPETSFEIISTMMLLPYRIPSITAYNRIESTPRSVDFDASLKAEVRDSLWMLTRQWQFGEFKGEDAGSAVTAQILGEHTQMDRLSFPENLPFPYDENIPLETTVEREKLTASLYLALQMSRYFLKLMKAYSLDTYLDKFITRYPLNYNIDDNDFEGQQMHMAIDNIIFDGYLLYEEITTTDTGETQSRYAKWINGDTGITNPNKAEFIKIADHMVAWLQRSYSQPKNDSDTAWLRSQLEYQFKMASPFMQNQKILRADQYYEGHLDWYSFDLDLRKKLSFERESLIPVTDNEILTSFIPSPIAFKGMPNPRFWTMEESQTDFGEIDTSTTGLLHLLFAEFGLIYSNDWFMLPYQLPINILCEIKGIVLTDVFGQNFLIRPAGVGEENNWQRWDMFHHTDKNDTSTMTNFFYLPPAVAKVLEGEPIEKVNFIRDEMANMVWAVENIVPSQAGKGSNGNEMALRYDTSDEFVPVGGAKIRYVLGTTVPDNWIPFIPVHMEDSQTEIRLQRAQMPDAKGALGVLLSEKEPPYFINEEEAPKAGIIVQRSFQRTRWLNGKTFLWIGRYKTAGTGEGWSNLQFDQIKEI
ncbi:MAG: hypothetical protein GY855_06830 [candidate division Zixibacteria bacterium]|nr:hypothetical protein [candidate division Zixibacteria bacterium]